MKLTFEACLSHPVSMHSLKHRLFNGFADLRQWPQNIERDVLQPFICHALDKNYTFGWSIHIHFLHWVDQHPGLQAYVDERFIHERMQAALRDWVLMGCEHLQVKGMLLFVKHSPRTAWGIWKSESALQPHRLVKLKMNSAFNGEDAFAYSYQSNNWSLNLQSIPL